MGWDGPLELERKSQEEGREERSRKRKEKVRQKNHRERRNMGTEMREPREKAG